MSDEQWWVSPLNFSPEVIKDPLPASVGIYDSTLRDGEQTIGVCFDAEDKVRIALELEAAGVKRIEAGMPIVSEQDREAIAEVVRVVKNAEVWTLCRCNRKDVDASLAAGVRYAMCEMATSPHKIKAYSYTEDRVLKAVVDTVRYAVDNGMYTAFFAVDATRADLGFLEKVYKSAVFEAGAKEVTVVDTLGVASPEAMYYLTRKVKDWVGVPVMAHCHNDFGMAVACTVAAVKAGATTVHVTVNGLGEKTGNADIAEVVFALEGLYRVKTGINLKRLKRLSKMLAETTRIGVSPLKPVVGDYVFLKESGVTVAQLVEYPPAVEGYSPDLVGSTREILLSKKSGKASVEYFLSREGVNATPEQVGRIVEMVKALGLKKKGLVTLEEFREIVKQVV